MVLAAIKFAMQDVRRALLPLVHEFHHETISNGFCLYGWLPPFRDFIGLANLKVNYVKYEKKQGMSLQSEHVIQHGVRKIEEGHAHQ